MRKNFKIPVSVLLVLVLISASVFASAFAAENDVISFIDSNLEDALIINGADADGDGDITEGELAQCTALYLNGFGISDLTGLQYATGCVDLDLSGNSIQSVSSIAGLTDLTRLNLAENSITSISSLANLTSLTHLYLNNNSISDISVLSYLTDLEVLCLQNNSISSLTGLSGHSDLEYLDLSYCTISSLTGLNDFTSLDYLNLSGNSIANASALSNFTGKYLYLSDNSIATVPAVSSVKHLAINRNAITSISPISSANLFYLSFSGNKVKDAQPLLSQPNLGSLTSHDNYLDVCTGTISNSVISAINVSNGDVNCSPQYIERMAGQSRIDTAISIALDGWGDCDNVILVNAYNFVDPMCVAPLAKLLDAPILLTGNTAGGLEDKVEDAINQLSPNKIYLIGGSSVISADIESYIATYVLTTPGAVERVYGDSRFHTCTAIANKVLQLNSNVSKCILVNSNTPADALSSSPTAAILGIPIFFTPSGSDTLQSTIATYISSSNFTDVIIVGGTGAVSQGVETQLENLGKNVTRLYGTSRYDTALCVYDTFNGDANHVGSIYNESKIALTAGQDTNFTDIVAGASLASKYGYPLLFVDPLNNHTGLKEAINGFNRDKVMVFGGTGTLSEPLISEHIIDGQPQT